MLRKDHSPDNSTTAEAGSQVTNVRIDLGGTTLAVVVGLVSIIGVCGVVIGLDISERAAQTREWQRQTATLSEKMQDLQRQYRMTELKLDDWTVVAHRSGLALPGDYARGPQGNLDPQSFQPCPDPTGRKDPHIWTCNPVETLPPAGPPPTSGLCANNRSFCSFTPLNSSKKP